MMDLLLAVAVATASPAPVTASPPAVSTVALSYLSPTHGYHSQSAITTASGVRFTATAITDAVGDRDVDATIDANGKSFHQEYLLMGGLVYTKAGDNWALATNLQPAFTKMLFLAGVYPVSSGYNANGTVVRSQGTAPCGASTCSVYVSSKITKFNEQQAVTVSHLNVDKAADELVSLDVSTFATDGKTLMSLHSTFDQFEGERLSVPAIAMTVTPICYLSTTKIGALDLCLYKGVYNADIYTLTDDGRLAMRVNEALFANAVPSPVIDGLTLQCVVKKQSTTVDPNLVATLKQSGMTDEQISAQLGEKPIGSDCTVNLNGATVMTQHYDFK